VSNVKTVFEVPGLFKAVPLKLYRKTKGVLFDMIPIEDLGPLAAIDRVLHDHGAFSPGSVGPVERPWYFHQDQEDNLVVLAGFRDVELFSPTVGPAVHLRISAERIEKDGVLLLDEPVRLSWPTRVFHRIISSSEKGSASINIAIRNAGFDIRTNFSIYDLDLRTGESRIIREGHFDQSGE